MKREKLKKDQILPCQIGRALGTGELSFLDQLAGQSQGTFGEYLAPVDDLPHPFWPESS
jgi:hypothetical protein